MGAFTQLPFQFQQRGSHLAKALQDPNLTQKLQEQRDQDLEKWLADEFNSRAMGFSSAHSLVYSGASLDTSLTDWGNVFLTKQGDLPALMGKLQPTLDGHGNLVVQPGFYSVATTITVSGVVGTPGFINAGVNLAPVRGNGVSINVPDTGTGSLPLDSRSSTSIMVVPDNSPFTVVCTATTPPGSTGVGITLITTCVRLGPPQWSLATDLVVYP